MLDELDFRISREVGGTDASRWKARRSYSEMARTMGVDEETFRLRLLRLRERGLLPFWRMLVNPILLDCREARVETTVTDESRKGAVIADLRGLEGVHAIMDFRGPEVAALLYHPSEADLGTLRRSIEEACGASSSTVWRQPVTPASVKMRALDWRLLAELQEDAWRDLKEVARELDVSTRTVQRRVAALVKGKAAYLWRVGNVQAVPGVGCHFLVTFSDAAKKRALDAWVHASLPNLGASETTSETTLGPASLYGVLCANLHEADAILADLKARPGVEAARMRHPKSVIPVPEWLAAVVGRRAKADAT